jgi:hypothetical protein
MESESKESTAIGTPIRFGEGDSGRAVRSGVPPVVLQAQAYGFVPLETPEQLRQWESDARLFYGIDVDASRLAGVAAETCSCGCSDDCGLMQMA